MRGLETSDDPVAEELRDSLDRIDDRMATYERALIRGQMAPDQFVYVYRSCIDNRDYVIRELALHEAQEQRRERMPETQTRIEPDDRTDVRPERTSQPRDRDRTAPSARDPLSPADIRAAVRQSQQSERPSTADQDRQALNERDRTPDDDRGWWERSRR